ncbi:DUF485 domain-containing protein [Crenobacter sp. SG2303]|uniref:DUF485 domain-containing protein n=1 Tax=Crenobacter oryzisoli TaxID=3056844 RepID=A0ABT7XMD0_9NEIS|nr:DUF485 domain-containing protein [Crenobacter sp. SG2303]MDN0074843.1 DUF485 domain-containing protein [Crenobacter sp. SG2303]
MPRFCLILLLALVAGYYGVVAFAPSLLAGSLSGWPVSIVVALALFALGFAITVLYARAADVGRKGAK